MGALALLLLFALWTQCVRPTAGASRASAASSARPRCIFMWGLWDNKAFPFQDKLEALYRQFGYPSEVLTARHVEDAVAAYAAGWNADIVPCYAALKRNVCKADLGRYLLIFLRGGLYLDNDVQIRRPLLQHEWSSPTGVWVLEKRVDVGSLALREREEPVRERIANYAFGSAEPLLPGLRLIIEECIRRVKRIEHLAAWSDDDVLWVTGPDVVSVVHFRHGRSAFSRPLEDFCDHSEAGAWRYQRDL